MSTFVVDSSVVIKWFVPEIHSREACQLLEQDHQYFSPDLLFAELSNTVWKKVQRGEFPSTDARRLMTAIEAVPVETIPSRALAADACLLAVATGRSAYDCLYLALAVRLGTEMVTADERLANALANSPLEAHVRSISDWNS